MAGLPPELLALEALTPGDLEFLREAYPSFDSKMMEALTYCDENSSLMTPELRGAIGRAGYDWSPHEGHLGVVREIGESRSTGADARLSELMLQAALLRRFLG